MSETINHSAQSLTPGVGFVGFVYGESWQKVRENLCPTLQVLRMIFGRLSRSYNYLRRAAFCPSLGYVYLKSTAASEVVHKLASKLASLLDRPTLLNNLFLRPK